MLSYLVFLLLATGGALWVCRADRGSRHRNLRLLVGSVFCLGILVLVTRGTPLGDFVKAYYPSGSHLLHGPQHLYDCTVSNLCFVNVPILAGLFIPFSVLPLHAAGVAFTILGLVLTAWAAWRLSNGVSGREGRLALALILLSGPLAYSVRLGNTSHMMLPLMLFAFEAVSRNRQIAAGLMLSLAALIKPFLVLFMVYLLVRRKFVAFIVMGGAAVLAILVSIALFGLDLHLIFLNKFVLGFGAKPVIAYNVQNFSGFIGHLMLPGNLENWLPLDEPIWFKMSRMALSAAAIVAVAVVLLRAGQPKRSGEWLAELAIVLCFAFLVAPVTWTHYLCLLLIPLCQLVTNRFEVPMGRVGSAAIALSTLMLSLPVLILPDDHLSFLTQRIWISHYFFGTVLLLMILLWTRLEMARAERSSKSGRLATV